MMPKLPKERILRTVMPDDYRYGHVCGYSSADVLAYGRAVAEACAQLVELEYAPDEKARRRLQQIAGHIRAMVSVSPGR